MALNNVPVPGQSLGASRDLINQNFSVINTAFAVNHVPYNDGSGNQGKHNLVTFPVQSPAPSFAAGEEGLYNLLNATTAKNELYVHKQTSASTADIPMTASILSQSVPASGAAGWTMLPSGILMRWENFSGNGLTTVTLSAGYISFTTIYSIMLTPVDTSTGDVDFAVRLVDILSATQFRVYFSSRSSTGAAAGNAKALIIGS